MCAYTLRTGGTIAVWICVAANAGFCTLITDVIPKASSLGSGWESAIEVLVDSEVTPLKILGEGEFSAATIKEWRGAVTDTNQPLSGWGRARFDFKSHAVTNRYYLYLERFRNQGALAKRWNHLLELGPVRHNMFPRGVGEAAFVAHEKGAVALWFRHGSFIVEVSSFGATPPQEVAGSMRYLATMADTNISISADAQRQVGIDQILPRSEQLGLGWDSNRVVVLLDPLSSPTVVTNEGPVWLKVAQDAVGKHACEAYAVVRCFCGSNSVLVWINRFKSKEDIGPDWGTDREAGTKATLDKLPGVGDEVRFYRRGGMHNNIAFRRGTYLVDVEGMGAPIEKLKEMAKVLDNNLVKAGPESMDSRQDAKTPR